MLFIEHVSAKDWMVPKDIVVITPNSQGVKKVDSLIVATKDKRALEVAVNMCTEYSAGNKVAPICEQMINEITSIKIRYGLQQYRNNKAYIEVACEIMIGDKEINIYIEQSSLFQIVIRSTMVNGRIFGQFRIAKYKGLTGIVSESLYNYKSKRGGNTPTKARVYKPGIRYYSPREDIVCLGVVYGWIRRVYTVEGKKQSFGQFKSYILIPTKLLYSWREKTGLELRTTTDVLNYMVDNYDDASIKVVLAHGMSIYQSYLDIGKRELEETPNSVDELNNILRILDYKMMKDKDMPVSNHGVVLLGLNARKDKPFKLSDNLVKTYKDVLNKWFEIDIEGINNKQC